MKDARNSDNVTTDHSASFKYKSSVLGKSAVPGLFRNAKIVVSLKYLSGFFRPLEMPLINFKIHLELNWTKDCVMSEIAGNATDQL